MRINLILPYLNYTGGMRVLAAYAHRLQQRGHTVAVRAVPRPEPGLRDKLERWWRGQGWFNGKKGGSHFDGLAVDQRIIERPRAIEDADVPDGDVVVAGPRRERSDDLVRVDVAPRHAPAPTEEGLPRFLDDDCQGCGPLGGPP